jgi:chromosome segregation ATPase
LRPEKHEKTHEIQVLKDELEQMTNEIKEKQAQFVADRQNHENQIKENQRRIDEMEIKAANERALLEQQYQQKIEELTKQMKEKNESYENRRTQAEESRKNFQEECQRDERNQEEVVKYRKLYMEFEKQCNTLTKDLDKTKKELMQLTKEKPKPESESWIKRLFALFFPWDNKSQPKSCN